MTTHQATQDRDPNEGRPFYQHLGLRFDEGLPAGTSRVHLVGREEFKNSRGDIHGGVVAAVVDAAMGAAMRSAYTAGEGTTTVSLTVNYLEPAREALMAEGRVMRAGRSLASVEVTVTDKAGRTVAHAIGTLRVIARRS
ncbi:MAG: hypothetical protein RL300_1012 [Pseudomonadota bacterium]|jgi:uncharacterized protein (TIGR00369 family)